MNAEFSRTNERAGPSAADSGGDPDGHPPLSRPSLRFLKRQHLRKSADFRRLYELGQRAGDDHLLVFALRNDATLSRIGLSVSRKHGGAVVRNRRKRLLREAFRLTQHELPAGVDFVLVPRQRTDSTLRDFQMSLRKLTQKLAARLPQHRSDRNPPTVPDARQSALPEAGITHPGPAAEQGPDHEPA